MTQLANHLVEAGLKESPRWKQAQEQMKLREGNSNAITRRNWDRRIIHLTSSADSTALSARRTLNGRFQVASCAEVEKKNTAIFMIQKADWNIKQIREIQAKRANSILRVGTEKAPSPAIKTRDGSASWRNGAWANSAAFSS